MSFHNIEKKLNKKISTRNVCFSFRLDYFLYRMFFLIWPFDLYVKLVFGIHPPRTEIGEIPTICVSLVFADSKGINMWICV